MAMEHFKLIAMDGEQRNRTGVCIAARADVLLSFQSNYF